MRDKRLQEIQDMKTALFVAYNTISRQITELDKQYREREKELEKEAYDGEYISIG